MVEINYSTRGKKCLGRWYRKTNSVTVFLNNLAKLHNPDTDFDSFLSELSAIEFHELGHIIGFRNGCKGCNGMNCYYCQLTDCISYFLKDGWWNPAYSVWMKKITFAIRMRKLPIKERLKLL